ncbi:MAG TPA: P-loop NTPase, partial [Candidatus Methylomirabilis sp.]
WRGPLVSQAVQRLLRDTRWPELDVLLVDLPPGTGDTQLTLVQSVPLAGAVIVTTPSGVSLQDAEKGLRMFRKVDVPVFGIVENMSYFVCPCCGAETDIFSRGGGRRVAEALDTPFLGELPLDPRTRRGGDTGEPVAAGDAAGPAAAPFFALAALVETALAAASAAAREAA